MLNALPELLHNITLDGKNTPNEKFTFISTTDSAMSKVMCLMAKVVLKERIQLPRRSRESGRD